MKDARFPSWIPLRILVVLAASLVTAPLYAPPPDLFVQVEQEGNLNRLPEDARGNLFRFYAPVENDEALVEKVVSEQSRLSRLFYRTWRRLSPSMQSFDHLSLDGKVRYLELLAEKRGGCRNGVPCELVERRESAPKWLSKHPFFESPPGAPIGTPVSFRFPEVTTDKDHPAATPREALTRHRWVIENLGLESPHFHVFVRVPRDRFVAQQENLLGHLQAANDELFLRAVRSNLDNAVHPTLRPWTDRMTERAREIMTALGPEAVRPNRQDEFDPKRVNLAFRYWGEKDGQVLISLELRGLRSFYERPPMASRHADPFAEASRLPPKVRSFAEIERTLDRVWATARAFEQGSLPAVPHVTRHPDLDRMEAAIAQVAREKGITNYLTYGAFVRRFFGFETPPPGLLYPFSDPNRGLETPAIRRFVEAYLPIAEEAARYPSVSTRYFWNQFWGAFDGWVRQEQQVTTWVTPRPDGQKSCANDLGLLGT